MEFTINHPDSGQASVLLIFDGIPYEADSDHIWWYEIIDLLFEDDERVIDLFPVRDFQRSSEYRTDPALEPLDNDERRADEDAREAQRWIPTDVKIVDSPVGPVGFTVAEEDGES